MRKTFELIGEHKNFLQDGLLSCLQTTVLVIDNELTDDDAKGIYQLVKEVFQNISDVNSEGLILISWIATCIGDRFVSLMDDFWKYINHAFTKDKQLDMLKAALIAVSETAKATGLKFEKYQDKVFPLLINLLHT